MKFTLGAILLAASSAFAAPACVARDNELTITDFFAQSSQPGGTSQIHFVLKSSNYPEDTPTECFLMWPYGSNPEERARCNNSQYSVKFPGGVPSDFSDFTLYVDRLSGSIPEKIRLGISDQAPSPWKCQENPRPGVNVRCAWEGVLTPST